ncbi:MAG: hypothetical protein ACRDK9_07645 [Solirubrobacterales bacterium]
MGASDYLDYDWIVIGSVVPANPGVNPSLTITALAEHAMTYVPTALPVNAAGEAGEGRPER